MKKISIITVSFNGSEDTLEMLLSFSKVKTPKGYELNYTLVDNGSTDGVSQKVGKKFPKVKIIKTEKNLGFAGGYNFGMKEALKDGADYVLIVNNDTILEDKELVINLLEVFENHPKAGLVGPKIHFAPGFEFHKKRYSRKQQGQVIWYGGGVLDWKNIFSVHQGVDEVDEGQYDKTKETDFVSGCVMMISGEVLKKAGFFDENYFAYFEDGDLNRRVIKAGYKLFYTGKTSIWHKTAKTSGGSGSDFHEYYITRNRLIFGMRWAPIRSKIALLRESFRLLLNGRKYQKQGVIDFYLRKWGKGGYG